MNFGFLRVAVLIGAIAGCMEASAAPITPSQALSRLSNSERSRLAKAPAVADLVYTKSVDAEPAIYVFSGDDGYMVVSADDAAPALLGYSDGGKFDINNAPANMLGWLEEYADQISAMRRNPSTQVRGALLATTKMKNVAPLLTTLWNQGSPYNLNCPKVGTTSTYTGCVATAMAQVMKYHNWPPKGQSSHSYLWINGTDTTPLSMDFSKQTFAWNDMTDTYGTASTTAQKNAVAQLMSACGISVDMSYGTSASGAVSTKVAGALINYFDYCKEAIALQRAYMKYDLWEENLYKSLTEYGPVYYTGRNTSGGHAFVCDGYRDGYWHINWGWGGSSNGYFLLTAMDPSSQGIGGSTSGYNSGQTMTVFTKPMYEGSKRTVIMGFNKVITPTYTPLTRSLKLAGFFFNMCPDTIRVGMGMLLTSPSGEETYIGEYNGQLLENYGFSYYTLTLPALTENGIYKVQPIYYDRDADTKEWKKMYGGPGIQDYVELAANNGSVTVKASDAKTLQATDLTFNSPFYRTQKFSVTSKVTNPNPYEVMTEVYGSIWTKSGSTYSLVAYGAPQMVLLSADGSKYVDYVSTFTSNTPAIGNYYFAMAVKSGSDMVAISDFSEISVANNVDAVLLTAPSFTVENSSSVDTSKPIKMNATIRDTNGIYANYFDVYLFKAGASSSSSYFRTPFFYIGYGESKDISFEGTFGDAEYTVGENCTVQLYYYRSSTRVYVAKTTFTVGSVGTGVDALNADAESFTVAVNDMEAIISSRSEISRVEIFTLNGMLQNADIQYNGTQAVADISALNSGVYMLRIIDADGMHNIKMMKK